MNESEISRRDFLAKSTASAGLILAAPNIIRAETKNAPSDEVRVGFIGCGKQHEALFAAMTNLPGIRYVAACDIMKDRVGRTYGQVKSLFDQTINRYLDAEEMLAKEAGKMDAVFISTPDFWHAPHTVMTLDAGFHVYCEKMMSNTLEGARSMVAAADRTGKLCQIGHQRRSNPRYLYTLHELIHKQKLFGDIVNANAQWNRALSSSQDIQVKPTILPDEKTLIKYGFATGASGKPTLDQLRHRFLNWRFYKDLSGGPISDLGAHQIDIFNWYFDAVPISVMASGGRSFFRDREHFDNVMCIFDYDTKEGNKRAFYQVLTTTSAGGGYYEAFMGTQGTMEISEREAYTNIYLEGGADDEMKLKWEDMVRRGYLKKVAAPMAAVEEGGIDARTSAPPEKYALPGGLSRTAKPHTPHVHNFLEAIRGNEKLNCDARHALKSEAPIYWVNPAAESRETIKFTKEHLHV